MSMLFFKNTNLFTVLTKFLIIVLPFYVIIKVYADKILDMWFLGFFIKEFIIVLLFLSLIYEYFINKNNNEVKLKFDYIDYIIFIFIAYWVIISLFNGLWFNSIFFGWRYDFLWFIVFLIYRHWRVFLKEKFNNLVKLFLLSASISLFLWIMVKFVLGEEILSFFGFTIEVAQFWFWWWIPIYQWVEASWIRRFQWILDSPLAMWYFLLLFSWLYSYLNRKNLDYGFFLWLSFLFVLIFLTYSRGAMLWVILAVFILFLFSFRYIFKYYKRVFIYWSLIFISLVLVLSIVFQDKLYNVFLRDWSTSWHLTRMETWIERFLEKPLWSWLATAGPWYRYIIEWETSLETDRYYIPESWFVQILVEWGIIYFTLFILILTNILHNLYRNNYKFIFVMFIWILVMNFFLHVFEYTYITILLFLFLGLFYKEKSRDKNLYKLAKN